MKKVLDNIFKIVALCVLVCLLGLFCFAIINGIVNIIRKHTFKIDLPKTPASYSSYDFSGDYVAEYKLTNIEYEVDGNDLTVKFEGKKTYDIDGNSELRKIQIIWQLIDSNNNIVASDEVASPKIEVGEKFAVESEDYNFDIDFEEDYHLIIKHAYEEETGDLHENEYENLFLGKWATSSGENAVIYSFYKENGEYKAGCVTSGYKVYEFDKYTATSKTIMLYQDGKCTKYFYSFEDGYLYMDGLEFETFIN